MKHGLKVVDTLVDVTLGSSPSVGGRVYEGGRAQLTFESGCVSFTCYPSADALDTLAAQLSEMAYATRRAQNTRVVA